VEGEEVEVGDSVELLDCEAPLDCCCDGVGAGLGLHFECDLQLRRGRSLSWIIFL
jgi:hypothetical protein